MPANRQADPRAAWPELVAYRVAGDGEALWEALSVRVEETDALTAPQVPKELAIDGRAVMTRELGVAEVGRDPLLNINTPEDLAYLEAL